MSLYCKMEENLLWSKQDFPGLFLNIQLCQPQCTSTSQPGNNFPVISQSSYKTNFLFVQLSTFVFLYSVWRRYHVYSKIQLIYVFHVSTIVPCHFVLKRQGEGWVQNECEWCQKDVCSAYVVCCKIRMWRQVEWRWSESFLLDNR